MAPAAAARLWSTRLSVITALAVVFGLAGLYASSRFNVSAGASITLTATGILLLSSLLSRARHAWTKTPAHTLEAPA